MRFGKLLPLHKSTFNNNSMVSCHKGPTRHANAWQIGPFWQDTLAFFSAAHIYASRDFSRHNAESKFRRATLKPQAKTAPNPKT